MLCVYRDGQSVDGNTLGGVITNLHQPRDWSIFEQLHPPLRSRVEEPKEQKRRVHFAVGCHPKQAFRYDFAIENSHFWTPGTLDMYLERVKMTLSHALPCIGM